MNSRRDFITLLGGAAMWPVAVRAQLDATIASSLRETQPLSEAQVYQITHIAKFYSALIASAIGRYASYPSLQSRYMPL